MRRYKVLRYASSVEPTGKCVVCEGELPRGRRKYCSDGCADKFYDENTMDWNRIRMHIIMRDKFRCQECNHYSKDGSFLHVHHIKPEKDYPELVFVHDNLITLCEGCHRKEHKSKLL